MGVSGQNTSFIERRLALLRARAAFVELLITSIGKRLHLFAQRCARTLRSNSAEDLMQSVWKQALESPALYSLPEEEAVLHYLFRSVRNTAATLRDSAQNRREVSSDEDGKVEGMSRRTSPDTGIALKEWLETLDLDRQTMLWMRVDGFKHNEIAEVLKITEAAARRRWCDLLNDAPAGLETMTR